MSLGNRNTTAEFINDFFGDFDTTGSNMGNISTRRYRKKAKSTRKRSRSHRKKHSFKKRKMKSRTIHRRRKKGMSKEFLRRLRKKHKLGEFKK